MHIDYVGLLPELILASFAMAVLVTDLLPVSKHWTATVALFGLFSAAIPALWLALFSDADRVMLGGSYVVDDFSLVLKALFLIAGFVTVLMSVGYLESDRFYQGEFYFLLMASITGAVVMASARDLIAIFIGLELVSGPSFLLAGWRKGDVKSNEAALKFFIIGVLSSAILLFGMSLVYGATGAVDFEGIRAVSGTLADKPVFVLGVLFVLGGFAFKVSAVPFHFWAPDTYQGAPLPVAAYLSVGSKAAGFVGLLTVCYLAFAGASELWGPALWIIAAVSMTVGNLTALRQTNLVRLLGYSSIAHGGFILVPFAMAASLDDVGLNEAFFATVTYLLIYAFMNLGAFAAVIAGARKIDSAEMDDWAGMATYSPVLGGMVIVFFFALAGIPPLAGWFAKLVMFRGVLNDPSNAWAVALAAIAAVNAVIAFVYYARVVKTVWMDAVPETISPLDAGDRGLGPSLRLALVITTIVVVAVGVYPDLLAFFGEATEALIATGF